MQHPGQSWTEAFRDTLAGHLKRTLRKVTHFYGRPQSEYTKMSMRDLRSDDPGYEWWQIVEKQDEESQKPDIIPQTVNISIPSHYMEAAVARSSNPLDHWKYHLNNVVRPTVKHTRLFITSEGYMGLGALATKPGDVVYVAKGGEMPLLLRPCYDVVTGELEKEICCSHSDRSVFTLVGTSYLHGLMDGEVCQMDGVEVKQVHIS